VKRFNEITCLPGFKKDIKKLVKRWRTLEEDLEFFIKGQLYAYHKKGIDNKGIVQLRDLGFKVPQVYKARKFACRSLPGKGARTGIRVIYAYFKAEDRIELIEIYYKGDKKDEDKERILRHYKG